MVQVLHTVTVSHFTWTLVMRVVVSYLSTFILYVRVCLGLLFCSSLRNRWSCSYIYNTTVYKMIKKTHKATKPLICAGWVTQYQYFYFSVSWLSSIQHIATPLTCISVASATSFTFNSFAVVNENMCQFSTQSTTAKEINNDFTQRTA